MRRAGSPSFPSLAPFWGRLPCRRSLARGDPPAPRDFCMPDERRVQDDRVDDGDIDEEDRSALRMGGQPGAADVHGQSWLSVVGFGRQLWSGKNDIGAGLVLALALDRIAQGPVHKIGDAPPPYPRVARGVGRRSRSPAHWRAIASSRHGGAPGSESTTLESTRSPHARERAPFCPRCGCEPCDSSRTRSTRRCSPPRMPRTTTTPSAQTSSWRPGHAPGALDRLRLRGRRGNLWNER